MSGKRILFASPFNLLDRSSGAAISCHTMLKQMAARGDHVASVGATIFDKPAFEKPAQWFADKKAEPVDLGHKIRIWRHMENGITHYFTPSLAQFRPLMTSREEEAWWAVFCKAVADIKPDCVIGFGGQILEQLMWRWLKDKKIPSLFYLANPGYLQCDWLDQLGAIMTDTQATAQIYKEKIGVDAHVVGKFIEPVRALPQATRDHILFINPVGEKGVALFIALAQAMAKSHPQQRFLVVESRGKLAPIMQALGVAHLPNVSLLPLQPNMTGVWNATKILLLPSFWHESGSRLAVEALSLGIPVLASPSGGMPAMLNGSGKMLPVPARTAETYLEPVAADMLAPWLAQLRTWVDDPQALAQAQAQARAAWSAHPEINDISRVDRAIAHAAH